MIAKSEPDHAEDEVISVQGPACGTSEVRAQEIQIVGTELPRSNPINAWSRLLAVGAAQGVKSPSVAIGCRGGDKRSVNWYPCHRN